MKGLIRGAIIIRQAMDHIPPLIPIDTGNLRDSWFTNPLYHFKDPALLIGFTAIYAVIVHENYGANFQRPNAGAGFFQSAINNNQKQILAVIAKEAKIR